MSLPASLTDAELYARLLRGDEAAFTQLYRRHKDAVYRFVLMLAGASGLAADATQEAFLLLIHEPGCYQPERGALPAFLMGVARNHVRRGLTHAPQAWPLDDDGETADQVDIAPTPLARLLASETLASLHASLLELPFAYREALVLCDLQELSYQDAAAVIGCPVGTIRSRLNRARSQLAERLLLALPAGLETTP